MRASQSSGLYRRGMCWLLLLAPLFFVTYGQVNMLTATRTDVGQFALPWESSIPFLPWTIVPYWSIDLLYGVSLFICTSRQELFRHGFRLLIASVVACLGFLLFPLQFSWQRPEVAGVFGWLFSQLEQFDLPYNQAPSLHIILTWLLWLRFRAHLSGLWQIANTLWFSLIAISVLTTWQHHFIDVLSGFIVGVFISYLIPIEGNWTWQTYQYPAKKIAFRYTVGSILVFSLAYFQPLLLWPALALFLIMLGYLGAGVSVWQKAPSGRLSPSAQIIFLPILLVATPIRRYFCRSLSAADEIVNGLYIGHFPSQTVTHKAVLDLSAEFSVAQKWTRTSTVYCFPLLDLKTPELPQLHRGVALLDTIYQQHGQVLVHCALGMSRSALIVAGWLLYRNSDMDVIQAIATIEQKHAPILLSEDHHQLLRHYKESLNEKNNGETVDLFPSAEELAFADTPSVTSAVHRLNLPS